MGSFGEPDLLGAGLGMHLARLPVEAGMGPAVLGGLTMADVAYRTWRPFPTFPHGRRLDGYIAGRVEGEGNLLVPSLCVEEAQDGYTILAVIPGVERDELTVSFQQGVLRIAGERRRRASSDTRDVHRRTSYLSRFTREIRLDQEVDVREAEAHFEGGVLTVRLPILPPSRRARGPDPTMVHID